MRPYKLLQIWKDRQIPRALLEERENGRFDCLFVGVAQDVDVRCIVLKALPVLRRDGTGYIILPTTVSILARTSPIAGYSRR